MSPDEHRQNRLSDFFSDTRDTAHASGEGEHLPHDLPTPAEVKAISAEVHAHCGPAIKSVAPLMTALLSAAALIGNAEQRPAHMIQLMEMQLVSFVCMLKKCGVITFVAPTTTGQ